MSIFDTKNCYATIDAFYALNLTEFQMHMHTHPRCEIMYVVKGECFVLTPTKEYRLSDRQFIFLDAKQPHQLYIPEKNPCSILNLEFSCSSLPSYIDFSRIHKESPAFSLFLNQKRQCFEGTDSQNLGYALKDLISRLKINAPDEPYLINLLFSRVLLELALCSQKASSSGSVNYLKKACEYISSHLTEEIRIPQIASYAGINKSYLHALFSKYMNCTIVDYINQSRLTQAVFLLTNSSLSITEIAFQTGFNSRQHFSATFEKYYHLSPRAYRQLNQRFIIASSGEANFPLYANGTLKETLLM